MDKIARIRQEIERNRQAIRVLNEHTAPEQMSKTCAIFQYSDSILSGLNSFLDTLSEEPNKSLEEAAEKSSVQYYKDAGYSPFPNVETAAHEAGFIAGAEWQKSQMLKDAVEADVNTYKDPVLSCGWVEFVVDMPSSETDKFGDKVRIIIVKED